jgi:hypothetical protein
MPHEFGIFVRSEAELDRAKAAVTRAGMASRGSFGASARSRPCSLPSDFIVRVDDGRGADDPLNFIVEIKGYRREDAKEKKSTMDTNWVPGVNHLGTYGRWAFAEFGDVSDWVRLRGQGQGGV